MEKRRQKKLSKKYGKEKGPMPVFEKEYRLDSKGRAPENRSANQYGTQGEMREKPN